MQITTTTLSFNDGAEAAQFFVGLLGAATSATSLGLLEKLTGMAAVTAAPLKDTVTEQPGQPVGAMPVDQEFAATTEPQTEGVKTGKPPRKTASAKNDNKPVSTPTTATEGEGGASAKSGGSDSPKGSASTETVSQNSKPKQVTYDEVRTALMGFADDLCLPYPPETGRELFRSMLTEKVGIQNVRELNGADMGKLTDVFSATIGEGPYALDAEVYAAIAAKKAEQASEV